MISEEVIDNSVKLINRLDQKINNLEVPANRRCILSAGCLDIASEFHKAIIFLVSNKLFGAAFSLKRSLFESIIRGLWLLECATEQEIDKFEKGKTPTLSTMINSIENKEEYSNTALSKLKDTSWDKMHDYVHTGFNSILRRQNKNTIQANYNHAEVLNLLKFANNFGYVIAVVLCDISDNEELADQISKERKNDAFLRASSKSERL